MKLRYFIATCIVLRILEIIFAYTDQVEIWFILGELFEYATVITLIYAIYVGIRKIFRTTRDAIGTRRAENMEAKPIENQDAEKEILRKSNEILIHLVQDKGNQK